MSVNIMRALLEAVAEIITDKKVKIFDLEMKISRLEKELKEAKSHE